jgi:uncharacterized protein (TIGR02246 family)
MGASTAVVSAEVINQALDRLGAALEALDADGTADCFAEDAEMVQLHGTFRGRDAIRGFFAWSFALATDVHFEERGFGRQVAPPFVYLEAVESLTMTDGTTYSVPLLGVGEFNESGEITRWVRSSDRWSIVVQGARQMSGPLGVYFRWFLHQIDQSMTKGMPTPAS